MALTQRQRRTLESVCETILGSYAKDLPDQVLIALQATGRPEDMAQFKLALTLLDTGAVNLVLSGRPARLSALDQPGREALLRAWATHPVPAMRQAFQALKRLVGFLHYANPSNPVWERWGYAGSSTEPPASASLTVEPLRPDEAVLTADAVVVGSGAGGGVVAAKLAARGLQVIVLEMGGHFPEADLGMPEVEGMEKLYFDRGMLATRDLSVTILAGSAVGGGTLVNWTASLAPPDWLRAEWEQQHGLTGLASPAFHACVTEVMDRIGANLDLSYSPPHSPAGRLLLGCERLGLSAKELPRNVGGCGHDCGMCTFGCRSGAKQGVTRTFLADAARLGARIIPEVRVDRVLIKSGQAVGVEATCGGRRVTVRAPRVVVSAGAIGTPALLLRSGLNHPALGRNLYLHPVGFVLGLYEEPSRPWENRLLPAYCNEFARVDGNYGFLIETPPVHPGIAALCAPWQSAAQYRGMLEQLAHLVPFLVLVRDREGGQVTVDRQGRHQVDYRLSAYDRGHVLRGLAEAIRIQHAAGARKVLTTHSVYTEAAPKTAEEAKVFGQRVLSLPSGPNRMMVASAHQMGTARMGPSAKTAVADPTGQVYGVKGLYVADASGFPAASGVNPMVTIMSLANWVVGQIG